MAEVQKNVEVPQDTKVEETAPVVPELPKDETPLTATEPAAPVADAAVEDKPAETAEDATAVTAEEPKEEVKPIEEGLLSHKAQGLSFPKYDSLPLSNR